MRAGGPRIVVLDAATVGDVSLQRFVGRWDCTIHPVTHPSEVRRRLLGHSVAITNKVAFDRLILDSPEARDLRLIAVAATGTDIVDLEMARKLGVRVSNVPGYATHSVAQFTMALMLELATRVCQYSDAVRRGGWQQSPIFTLLDYPTVELNGKKLGIVGYGSIGKTVATMARGFGLEVLIGARPGRSEAIPIDRLPLEDLFRQADIITLHCPLTQETRNLINDRALASMKPSAFLINTARGALVDEAALLQALREKRLGGAALDVVSREPPGPNHPLFEATKEMRNLIITPHTAWSAREARERLLREVADNISAFLTGEMRNVVV
jgi:glycerate dehydrogenase